MVCYLSSDQVAAGSADAALAGIDRIWKGNTLPLSGTRQRSAWWKAAKDMAKAKRNLDATGAGLLNLTPGPFATE